MASERMAVRRWIFQTLKNDAALKACGINGVYQNRAAQGVDFPFVVISTASGGDDTSSLGGKRAASELFFQVAVESEDGTVFDEEGAVNRIDALLHGVLKEDAFPRFSSRREREADENTFGSALSTRMSGAVYRFLVNGQR